MNEPETQEAPDGIMLPEQLAVAQSLSQDTIDRIDAELLKQARHSPRKVAMIIGMAMSNKTIRVPGLPDLYYAERIKELVRQGQLIADGNLDFMRYCEVKLP